MGRTVISKERGGGGPMSFGFRVGRLGTSTYVGDKVRGTLGDIDPLNKVPV